MTNIYPNHPSVTTPLYSARGKATKSPIFQGSVGSSYAYGQTLGNCKLCFERWQELLALVPSIHTLASTSKLQVTRSVTNTTSQCGKCSILFGCLGVSLSVYLLFFLLNLESHPHLLKFPSSFFLSPSLSICMYLFHTHTSHTKVLVPY